MALAEGKLQNSSKTYIYQLFLIPSILIEWNKNLVDCIIS